MAFHLPLSIKLSRAAVSRHDRFCELVMRTVRPSPAYAGYAIHAFAFKNDEEAFARELFARQSNMWLFRTNQRAFSGDFVAVDMSSPKIADRRPMVIELKRGGKLRVGRGAPSMQLKNAADAVRALARGFGIIDEETPFGTVSGDTPSVLELLGGHAAS